MSASDDQATMATLRLLRDRSTRRSALVRIIAEEMQRRTPSPWDFSEQSNLRCLAEGIAAAIDAVMVLHDAAPVDPTLGCTE